MANQQKKIFENIESILRGKTGRNLEIGFISAENGMGKQLSDSENNKRNETLRKKLENIRGVGVFPIQGNFGGLDENSFLTTGVTLQELKELAKEFNQQAFIYGNGRNDDMIFHYMEIPEHDGDDYESVQIRRTFVYKPNSRKNFSMYKGVKFIIPFFDNDYSDIRWDELSDEERGELPNLEDNDEEKDESLSAILRIRSLIESLKIDEKKVKIRVKHSDLLEIPKGKKFYNVPFKHYVELVNRKGYSQVARALNNLVIWHKDEHHEIGSKAQAILDKLKDKFRPED